MQSRTFLKSVALACTGLLPLWSVTAQAQVYPIKPVTVVVPFGAGGGVDATARLIMPKLAFSKLMVAETCLLSSDFTSLTISALKKNGKSRIKTNNNKTTIANILKNFFMD